MVKHNGILFVLWATAIQDTQIGVCVGGGGVLSSMQPLKDPGFLYLIDLPFSRASLSSAISHRRGRIIKEHVREVLWDRPESAISLLLT